MLRLGDIVFYRSSPLLPESIFSKVGRKIVLFGVVGWGDCDAFCGSRGGSSAIDVLI